MQKKKKIRNSILISGLFLLGIGIGVMGMYGFLQFRSSQNAVVMQETPGLVTDKIAIVNLDEGVTVKEEEINYAAKLLNEPPDNFIFTGLQDARGGYATGIYAGYMIIPATFSESVVSLNDTPVRAEISYAINSQLEESVKEKVIYDVLGLVSELNNRVSYMYLHSVLDEFHDAQDQSDVVMENDLEEKEAINAVQANDLVALVPVTEMTVVEYNIEPVDISEYMSKNVELTGQVGTKYMEYLTASEEDHQKLNEEAMALMTEMGNMDSIMGGINLAVDGEGNSVYQNGAEELGKLFEEHNTALGEKKAELDENVLEIYEDIQNYFLEYDKAEAAYEKEYEQKYLNTLNALEALFNEYQAKYATFSVEEIQQINSIVEQQNEQLQAQQEIINELQGQAMTLSAALEEEAEGEEGESVQTYVEVEVPEIQTYSLPETENEKLSELQQKMQEVLAANYYVFSGYQVDDEGIAKTDEEGNYLELCLLLSEYMKDLKEPEIRAKVLEEQVGNIEEMDIAEATQIVDEGILMPIQENVDAFITAVMDQYAIEKEQLGNYSEAVMDYNPLEYIDHDEIQSLTEQMYDNGADLSEAILETDIQQMEYVGEVYEATQNDLNSLQESIVQAKEDSDRAVEEGLAELKDIKNQNSEENQLILYDFSNKLPYTRLGSLEYRQAYEFMVNPLGTTQLEGMDTGAQVNINDTVRQESDSVNVQLNKKEDYNNIVMIITGMICVIIVGTTIKYHFHRKENPLEG
ncbi:MAG: hypothetical protein Q4D94_13215 [Bacillota bacterium]|nr:hypothetical protein [Bacillota bacterium]